MILLVLVRLRHFRDIFLMPTALRILIQMIKSHWMDNDRLRDWSTVVDFYIGSAKPLFNLTFSAPKFRHNSTFVHNVRMLMFGHNERATYHFLERQVPLSMYAISSTLPCNPDKCSSPYNPPYPWHYHNCLISTPAFRALGMDFRS